MWSPPVTPSEQSTATHDEEEEKKEWAMFHKMLGLHKPCTKRQGDHARNNTDEQDLYIHKLYRYEFKWLTIEIIFTLLTMMLTAIMIVSLKVDLDGTDEEDEDPELSGE